MTEQSVLQINVYGEPPTAQEVDKARQAARQGDRREAWATNVMMYCPVPLVDVVAAVATYAVMCAATDDPMEPLRDDPKAAAMDWSGSDAVTAYVAKVRGQGRHLLQIEVAALKDHLSIVARAAELASGASYIVNLAKELGSRAGAALTSSK